MKNYDCHKNKIRTNESKIWKIRTIRTLRLSQIYLVLIKTKSVSDKHAKQAMLCDSPRHFF